MLRARAWAYIARARVSVRLQYKIHTRVGARDGADASGNYQRLCHPSLEANDDLRDPPNLPRFSTNLAYCDKNNGVNYSK